MTPSKNRKEPAATRGKLPAARKAQTDKPLLWLHGAVKTPPWSAEARREAGFLLRRVQLGELLSMPGSRLMPSIGAGVHELRIKDDATEWRIIYRVDADAIVIAEVFAKKTRATPPAIIATCQRRLRLYDQAAGEPAPARSAATPRSSRAP